MVKKEWEINCLPVFSLNLPFFTSALKIVNFLIRKRRVRLLKPKIGHAVLFFLMMLLLSFLLTGTPGCGGGGGGGGGGDPTPTQSATSTPVTSTGNVSGHITTDYFSPGEKKITRLSLDGVTVSIGDLSTTSDSKGNYLLEDVPIGSQILFAAKAGYQEYSEPVRVNENQTATCSFKMGRVYSISKVCGTVTDASTGKPLEDVEVSVGPSDVLTDSKGYYEITPVPGGERLVNAAKGGYHQFYEEITVPNNSTLTKDISLSVSSGLKANTKYNWQVNACNYKGKKTEGPQWTFTTGSTLVRKDASGKVTASYTQIKAIEGPVTEETARTIAMANIERARKRSEVKKVYGNELKSLTSNSIGEVKELRLWEDGELLAYVFQLNPKGYIVVPSNCALPPVMAYSYSNDFSWEETSQNILLHLLRRDITLRLAALRKNLIDEKVRKRDASLWDQYLKGKLPADPKSRMMFGPLFTFPTWNQTYPYNKKCPIDDVTGERCYVGCVATATSQVLNYWRSPGSIVTSSNDDYYTRTREMYINAASASMEKVDYNGGYPDADNKAGISFAVGVLVEMDYTSEASGAYMDKAHAVLNGRLGYGNAELEYAFPRDYVIQDIKNSIPIIFSVIRAGSPGHALNIDGYDDVENTFHLNLGWGGDSNGWYSVPGGMPNGYDSVAACIYHLDPTITAPSAPETPSPTDDSEGISKGSVLTWEACKNTDSYEVYLWEASSSKPSTPALTNQPEYYP